MGAILALPLAAIFGLAAGLGVACMILAAPFLGIYEVIRQHLPRRAPKPR